MTMYCIDEDAGPTDSQQDRKMKCSGSNVLFPVKKRTGESDRFFAGGALVSHHHDPHPPHQLNDAIFCSSGKIMMRQKKRCAPASCLLFCSIINHVVAAELVGY
mmetsp:Transcript_12578/g.36636  ORF Transcript_12578/g.36636 Transcript_12578/m.36636 type:complete len:104 (+) Transcript_12578:338-649(+)